MDKVETVKKAKNTLDKRLELAPDFPIFKSIEAQLKYLLSILEGVSKDRSRLKEINVGVLAVREFEESALELASDLRSVQYVVYKMTGGIG